MPRSDCESVGLSSGMPWCLTWQEHFATLKGDCSVQIHILQTVGHLKAKPITSSVVQCAVNCANAGGKTCYVGLTER